jgi:hypothetical protein
MRAIIRPAHSNILRPALFANSQRWFTASSRGASQAYKAMATGANSGTLYLVIVRMLDEANHLDLLFHSGAGLARSPGNAKGHNR